MWTNPSEDIWSKLAQFGVKRRCMDDELYQAGNKLCESVLGKKSVIIFDNEDFLHKNVDEFPCHVPGCKKSFDTLIKFEEHYNSNHKFVCITCKKRLPSPHFLDLHVSETHDSYFAVLAERKPMYQCFVESCELKFSDANARHSHCIEDHKFPADFRYDSFKGQSKKTKSSGVDKPSPKYIPPKVHGFGHNSQRGLMRNKRGGFQNSRGKSKVQEVSMTDLEEALPKMDE